jgi:hypothetical protein
MIDRQRLLKDAPRLDKSLPRRKENTGATAAVAAVLPDILSMRAAGVRWVAIAAALAKQGVVEGDDRRPISANRLTSIVHELQQRKKAIDERLQKRAHRPDLVKSRSAPKAPLMLAPELTTSRKLEQNKITEEDIRRDNLAGIQHLLKPPIPGS